MKTINFDERYTEYWVNESEDPKNYFFSEEEIEKYVRQFPQGTMILTALIELDCKGHTERQIRGLDELDCGVYHEFLEHPKLHALKSLGYGITDCFRPSFYRQNKD